MVERKNKETQLRGGPGVSGLPQKKNEAKISDSIDSPPDKRAKLSDRFHYGEGRNSQNGTSIRSTNFTLGNCIHIVNLY